MSRHGIDCDLIDGGFVAALNRKQLDELRHEVAIWANYGHAAPYIVERDQVGEIVATDRYAGGMVDPLSGHFHPLNYLLGEAAAFEAAGGTIHERSRVTSVEQGAKPVVRTAQGSVTADIVLVCGNAYLDDAVPALTARIMPVSSQIIVTEPLGDRGEGCCPATIASKTRTISSITTG